MRVMTIIFYIILMQNWIPLKSYHNAPIYTENMKSKCIEKILARWTIKSKLAVWNQLGKSLLLPLLLS
jgi:hypothetical protein